LEQASRYKSEFLANMSHELRTPLNSLLILAKDLADNGSGNLTPEQVESAQIVHDSGRNLLGLINDILDLSKIEAGRMDVHWEDVALDTLGSHAERGFRRVAQDRGLAFSIDIAAGLPAIIRSDGTRLMQIVTNLLGNAFKFTHGGAVVLTIARPGDALPTLGEWPRARTLALTVSDSGIGIAEDKLARLFQPFEQGDGTTSRRYGGTGLGLSISRALAQMLGGEIVVRSTPGSGSQFTLLLPEDGSRGANAEDGGAAIPAIAPTAPAITAAATETAAAAPGMPRGAAIDDDRDRLQPDDVCVLVVEDDGAFARVLTDMARRKGYRVLVASDGESGLALARRYRPNGILLDVDLPVMNGWTVMERLKDDATTRDIPVHFVTATDEASRGLAMGAVGFLTKPATRESLDAAFQRILKAGDGEPRKLLVIEDDAGARHAVARLLAGQSIELAEAATAAQALRLLDEKTFDCIILDLTLPDASGFELLEQLARRGPLPPVVIYSAHELSREENLRLREYTDSIVIKGAHSPGRLLDEVSLFLHAMKKPSSPTPTAQQPSDLSGTVLVVDDDMRNVFALSKTLRSRGLKVLIAQDGHKALAQLEQNADVDWVLMDVMMPGMDGHEATREIRKSAEWRDLPVIAVTAKAMKGDREKCLEAGASDYLTKPIDIEKLLSMMRAWQRRR
ncbi:MAG TPA: response regulator, partial [Solimonas sp.]|nr:response regulator [Solimonas sp.]